MEQTTATKPEAPPEAKPDTRCPHCGEPAAKDQLVCLRCGGRIALDYRRPPGWKLPTAIVAGVALLAAVGFGWALREITDNARTEVADAGPAAGAQRRVASEQPQAENSKPAKPRRAAARRTPAPSLPASTPNAAGTWPAGKRGFTVILVSVENAASAKATVKTVKQSGVPAGYLRSNDYSSLQKGFWYVYGGVYDTRGKAEKAAAKFGRGYPGAYVQLVSSAKPVKKR